jgi:hypothetical protein
MAQQLEHTTITTHDPAFAVVIVPRQILNDTATAERTRAYIEQQLFQRPTVLMARDDQGVPNAYYGRSDLAIPLSRIPLVNVSWERIAVGGPISHRVSVS